MQSYSSRSGGGTNSEKTAKPAAKPKDTSKIESIFIPEGRLKKGDGSVNQGNSEDWIVVSAKCATQILLGGLTVAGFYTASLASRDRKSAPVTQRGPTLRELTFKLESIDAESRHKTAFRDLLLNTPATNVVGSETAPKPGEWLRNASELYMSITRSQRAIRDFIKVSTNQTTLKITLPPYDEALLPNEAEKQFLAVLASAEKNSKFNAFLTAQATHGYEQYESLHPMWPILALLVLHDELEKVAELNAQSHHIHETTITSRW
jgi:hypothetical protein